MENLFNELHIEQKNKSIDINLLANEWTNDFSRTNNRQLNSAQDHLQWSTEYLAQTESTLYDDA